MIRSSEVEIMDGDGLADDLIERTHRQLNWVNGFIGNTAAILRALRSDPLPVKRVLDIGCGHGGLLLEIRRKLNLEVVGVDLKPPSGAAVEIVRADATCDPLPPADVAISTLVGHHLSEAELVAMIQNVGRSCRRFVLLDLVRSVTPLVLFRVFLTPFLSHVNAADGMTSIRRAYTSDEMAELTRGALEGTDATFRHSVTPLRSRQVVDIRYR